MDIGENIWLLRQPSTRPAASLFFLFFLILAGLIAAGII
jgi:hypothetical protein